MTNMKKCLLTFILGLMFLNASAFDWKPQSNETIRNDMFSFVENFSKGTVDTRLASELDVFLNDQKAQAAEAPYAWIKDTHDFVDRMLEIYPAELSDGGKCSYERRNLLLLRDYPMHVDDKPKDAPKELKDAYRNATLSLYADAEAGALKWLKEGGRSKKLDIYKVYNMGFLFRSSGKVVAIDVQWSGSRDQMDEFASMVDVFFVTHPHGDHFTKGLLEAMLQAGKTVVLPCDLVPDYTGANKVVVGKDQVEPMSFGKVSFVSRMGDQGPRTPCNVYVVSLGKWNIAHNGDNGVEEVESFLSEERVDVLVSACWNGVRETSGRVKANPANSDCVWLSAHENEWRHTVDHREAYEELFRREDRLGDPSFDYLPSVILDAAGDRFILR